jgi:thiamine-phosphate diphosphorylase
VFDLLLITPDLEPREILRRIELALRASPAPERIAVQLRAKQLAREPRHALARALRVLTIERGAQLLINGELELALDIGADGVQLPEHGCGVQEARAALGPTLLVGGSRHDLAGVRHAARDGASFVTLSPIFGVPDKHPPLGLAVLTRVAAQSAIPIIALGGLTAERAAAVIRAGAHGLAVIRHGLGSDDPGAAVCGLLHAIDQGRHWRRE